MPYLPRLVYPLLKSQLYKGKTILLYGARRTGKTELIRKLMEEEKGVYFNVEYGQVRDQFSTTNTTELQDLVGNHKLIAFDEVQSIKDAGLVLKILHDFFPDVQFIATGSSAFEIQNGIAEYLLGRSRKYILYPFSMGELTATYGKIDTKARIENILRYGMYPEVLLLPEEEKKKELDAIISNYLFKDVLSLGTMKRPDLLLEILKLLAFQIGHEVNLNELSNKTNTSIPTIQRYLYFLEQSFIIIRLGALSRNLRNEIGKSRKYYFQDLGIRNAIINNFNPLTLRNDVGQLWENFCVMERIKKNEYDRRHVNTYFWRTYDQKEIDYIEEIDGKLYAFEFKWNETMVKPPKIFMDTYPESEFKVISKNNLFEFIKGASKTKKPIYFF
ncbi:MAG: ATP-binding protein [Saprospiraceae bacterium]|nr:ATP-binding protein [Candidatus Opimibacter skivensis]